MSCCTAIDIVNAGC